MEQKRRRLSREAQGSRISSKLAALAGELDGLTTRLETRERSRPVTFRGVPYRGSS
jgi:hypothetical protein